VDFNYFRFRKSQDYTRFETETIFGTLPQTKLHPGLLFRETRFSSANRLKFFGGKTVLVTVVGAMEPWRTTLATIVVEPNMSTSNRYNFVNSTPIWTIPSALETGGKRATFHCDNLKVRDMNLKQKKK